MVIVIGTFQLDPANRDAFIAGRVALMARSRAEHGCITYAFTADPIDDGVVILTERWASRASLDAHLEGLRTDPPSAPAIAMISRAIDIYVADDGTPL